MKERSIHLFYRLQRFTRTDLRYLAKGGSWSSLSYVMQVGFGIITTVALANLLPKEILGTYQFIIAMSGIIGIFTLTGMGTAIIRAVAQGHEGAFRNGVQVKLKWSVGVAVAGATFATYYAYNGNTDLAISFLIIAACVPLIDTFLLYESYLRGKQAFRDEVMLGLWRKPLPLIALLGALYFTDHVPTLIAAYFATTVISTILVYAKIIQKYQPPDTPHEETVAYSKQISVMGILSRIAEHADKALLWYLLGPVAVATFTIAQLATRYSGGLANVISHISLPKVSQRDLPTLQETLPRKVWIFTVIMIPLMLGYVFVVPFLFQFLFPEYLESIPLAQTLGILFLFLPRSVYGYALVAHKQTRALYILSITIPLIKLGAMASLILFFGIWGAVYALILTEAINLFITWYLFRIARAT
jgi:O-antigen/teichoic acid export membrane protein